ncbi:hypothetical protein C8F04DRAFT_1237990 [Mycena alexandri]|uniref:Uncharacterized protein n=1 Tax=Mycena alexandri TaxID=1745969 RepID=A0AAD6WWE0_9AGAR|nr:hypothetical protein C8F04DRAFT_1237990 [Mycena alexandri]
MGTVAKLVNASLPVVIAQYSRDDYGAGQEEFLHWALMVIVKRGSLEGPTWHAIDKHRPDGQVFWERAYLPKASLLRTSKCIGLVQIGIVKARDLKSFISVVGSGDPSTGHPVSPSFQGWRCKDWVLEVIEIIRETEGWIDESVLAPGRPATREVFYPALRRVAQATQQARQSDPRSPPSVEWIE